MSGAPLILVTGGKVDYCLTNLQGDVMRIDFFEKMFFESKASTSNSDNIKGAFYLPIFGHVTLPSFSFGFSWGMPIPLLY